MDNKLRFMAQELPENEMEMLYLLLGMGPDKRKKQKQESRFWNWLNNKWN